MVDQAGENCCHSALRATYLCHQRPDWRQPSRKTIQTCQHLLPTSKQSSIAPVHRPISSASHQTNTAYSTTSKSCAGGGGGGGRGRRRCPYGWLQEKKAMAADLPYLQLPSIDCECVECESRRRRDGVIGRRKVVFGRGWLRLLATFHLLSLFVFACCICSTRSLSSTTIISSTTQSSTTTTHKDVYLEEEQVLLDSTSSSQVDNPLLRHQRKTPQEQCHIWNSNTPADLCATGRWARLRLMRDLSLFSRDCTSELSNVRLAELFRLEWRYIKSENTPAVRLHVGCGFLICHQTFLPNGTCLDCKTWYRKWLLVQLMDIWQEPPCINWCYYTQLACPHLATSKVVDFAAIQPSSAETSTFLNSYLRPHDFFSAPEHCQSRQNRCRRERQQILSEHPAYPTGATHQKAASMPTLDSDAGKTGRSAEGHDQRRKHRHQSDEMVKSQEQLDYKKFRRRNARNTEPKRMRPMKTK
uniref:Uncharacterized protein n=1 Tax=Ditylenchus dipsaci TaxID=166011 RepID=A0A915EKL3_9BILA